MSSLWKTWDQIKAEATYRKVFLYGRSEDWVHKAIRGYGGDIAGIIDRDISYHDKSYLGLTILPIEKVDKKNSPYFIITAGDYGGIVERLEDLGYASGVDFVCSPDFRDYEVLGRLKSFENKVLVASSDYNDQKRARGSFLGGGIYLLDTKTGKFERKVKGSYRQLQKIPDGRVLAVEYVEKRVDVFSADYSIEFSVDLDLPNYCGLSVCDQTGNMSVLNAGTDEILTFDSVDGGLIKKRKFRNKAIHHGHHINDCIYNSGLLYCSYFSFSGGYKIDVFDGGVASLDPLRDSDPEPILTELWKPHTPRFFDGKIFVLDSMRGELVSGKPNFKAKFPGFVRGMDKVLQYYVVGQSEDMYVSERMNSETVMLNAGVYIYDSGFNASRFIPLSGLMNIHDVLLLEK